MRKFLLILVFLAFFVNYSFAFSVSAPSQTFSVPALTSKEVKVTVTSGAAENIAINLIEPRSWVTLGDSQMIVPAGGSKDVSVFLSPLADTPTGIYKVSVLFESLLTEELKKAEIFVSVEEGEILAVDKVIVTGSLQPLGSARIEIVVENRETVTVQGAKLVATVSSPVRITETIERAIPRLDPGQTTSLNATIFFERFATPGTYRVDAKAESDGEGVTFVQTFSVESISIFTREAERYPLLFGYGKKIRVTNDGNEAGDATVTELLSYFDEPFFSGDAPTVKNAGAYTWLFQDLAPGEAVVIDYRVDYLPLFLFIIALVVGGWIFFFKFRTVRIKKYIVQKKNISEGEEFTVAVEIINNLRRALDVEVHDFVPGVFHVKDGQGPKPARHKSHVGTEVKWHAKNLHPKESRVFTYKIVPMFGVHGTIRLPKAGVLFNYNKRTWETRSFSPVLGLPAEEKSDVRLRKFLRREK